MKRRRAGLGLLAAVIGLAVALGPWPTADDEPVAPVRAPQPAPPVQEALSAGHVAPAAPPGLLLASERVEPGEARLLVRVVDETGQHEPSAWAEAVDCPGWRPVASDEPEWLGYRAQPGGCSLRAVRPDGLIRTEGEDVRVEAVAGSVVRVELTLPAHRTGGVHFAFRPAREGVQLLWVPRDSPLADAELAPDDLLVAVNGEPVVDLAKEDLRDLLNGPEGTELVLEVLRAADTGLEPERLTVVREVIEPE